MPDQVARQKSVPEEVPPRKARFPVRRARRRRPAGGVRPSSGALLLLLGAVTACERPQPGAYGACEADTGTALGAPIYTFDGEPLNLPRHARVEVDRWVRYFRKERPERFALFLRRAGRYEEAIRAALRADGVPEDFLYLSLIESGSHPQAYSRSHAVGLWQFLESTGTVYGLEIDELVDERRDPAASTRAAVTYLSDLDEQFGNWLLAAAAYNGGPTRLARAIRRAGTRDYWELVRGGYLPRETSEYVPKILAAAWIGQEPGMRGFPLLRKSDPPAVEGVRLYGRNRLSVVAAAAGISEWEIAALNPALVRGITPPGRWTEVWLPAGTRERFEEVYALIPAQHRSGSWTHRVKRGETLGAIARSYGVTIEALLAANPAAEPRGLRVGQTLRVPPERLPEPGFARADVR